MRILFNYKTSKHWQDYKDSQQDKQINEDDLYVEYVFQQATQKLISPHEFQREWGVKLMKEIEEYRQNKVRHPSLGDYLLKK